ncbi:ANTAR domain-containing protein [Promicromonospora umidemergens]|uniref:histidine kinase n=1 Tax=Promicromonospora umidemergens TaxID=629679 RepID=A0ABP8XJ81_9MICO|nr:PAS domain-containing protein [Promicromonospora umidemergens]MCP2282204.1 ANTAR domain-containing protein [Promicromonospora umidemergens]
MSSFTQTQPTLAEDAGGDLAAPSPGLSAADLSRALGLGTNLLVGRYSVELASGTWWWSDEVYTMHGWRRDEVEPGLEALRSRKHPDDRSRVVRAAGEALRLGRPFACAHRIVDRKGRTRSVVVTGQGSQGPRGRSPELVGYVVDVTPVQKEALARRSDGVVNRAFVSQATIEQVKGVIVAVRGVEETAATDALVAAAKGAGVSLRLAADQVMAALRASDDGTAVTHDMLDRALAGVQPVGRPRSHDPLLTRRPRKLQS